MRVLVALILTAVALAGCADAQEPAQPDEPEVEFTQELEATETTGVIRGVVFDEAIVPVEGAIVTVAGTELSAETGADGLFGFEGVEPGTYFVNVEKVAYTPIQTNVQVIAGDDEPELVRAMIVAIPGLMPYVEALTFKGHLSCGAAIVLTSVGCTTFGPVANEIGDQSIFPVSFATKPEHFQAELVWKNTQLLAGRFIWEITPGGNTHIGYRETEHSPALAYLDTETIDGNEDGIMDDGGINLRFFGGPHDLCNPGVGFGCGVTLDQSAEVYAHAFYNTQPAEGWRFTSDGAPDN